MRRRIGAVVRVGMRGRIEAVVRVGMRGRIEAVVRVCGGGPVIGVMCTGVGMGMGSRCRTDSNPRSLLTRAEYLSSHNLCGIAIQCGAEA